MKIRQANQSDAHVLAPLVFASAPVALAATFDINDEFSSLNFLQSSLSHAGGQYGYDNHWIAEIDNQVVACFSLWHNNFPDSFHQATLNNLSEFYGIAHTLATVQASQVLQDCIPKLKNQECCIGHFSVLGKYQKQGVASTLLKFACEKALAIGKSALCLDVESSNLQAINFYLGQGFIEESKSIISPRMQVLGIGSHLHLRKKLI